MTRRLPPAVAIAAACLAAAVALSACGRVGMLEQPAPMYGAKAKADYQARKAAAVAASKASQDDGEPEPLAPDTPGLHDGQQDPGGLGADPVPGMQSMPTNAPPPGVLPDPTLRPK